MSRLPRRSLGLSGLGLTVVGLGAWAMGGQGWPAQDDRDSVATIKHAVSQGINWIDTAAIYGLGHSEEIVGRALSQIPAADRPFVFTKCGRRLAHGSTALYTDLRPGSIREDLDMSLHRLRLDLIDLFQIHWPDDSTRTPLEESWGVMARLQDEGKVRLIGVSNFTTSQIELCDRIRHVDSVQPPLSLIHPEAAANVIPRCRDLGAGVIVYSPMRSGLLTERMSPERVAAMSNADWRKRHPDFQPPNLANSLRLRDALIPLAKRHGVQVGTVAIAWTLSQPGVTAAIVGARNPDQVDGWLPSASLRLDAVDMASIERAITESRLS
jgi:aryl-alcohol dehydrogenase-like predicted oxidoreductase